jgi:hypothetical protein
MATTRLGSAIVAVRRGLVPFLSLMYPPSFLDNAIIRFVKSAFQTQAGALGGFVAAAVNHWADTAFRLLTFYAHAMTTSAGTALIAAIRLPTEAAATRVSYFTS